MIRTICMHRVLREAVATPYRNLVTRATGAAVRDRIEAALRSSPCAIALLDFSEVELLDFSCADEIVAKLMQSAAEPERVVVLIGVREEQREALEHVLAHHRLAVVARLHGSGAPELLGWATPAAREAFAALRARGAGLDDLARLALS
ncbi:MAG TPA: hypothetical protein VFU46_02385 [Gemmatimonadales bacterium]|nr:hypothetical protein [Gemmatimonadales bacterium]